MITQSILDFLVMIINWFIGGLPTIEIMIPLGVYDNVYSLFHGIGYFFPARLAVTYFFIWLGVSNIYVLIAIFTKIKSFIPGISGSG